MVTLIRPRAERKREATANHENGIERCSRPAVFEWWEARQLSSISMDRNSVFLSSVGLSLHSCILSYLTLGMEAIRDVI